MDGKVVAISGGSSGVGLAVAKGLAELGARTVILSRSDANGARAVEAVRAAGSGLSVEAVTGDPSTTEGAALLASTVQERTGGVDVLVSTAGSVGEHGLTEAGIPRVFATNYLTHFQLLRAMLPQLSERPDSRALIVGVAPALVRRIRTVPLDGVDADASTAALMLQSVAWKLLLARHITDAHPGGPSVNVFHPGLIRSNLLATQVAPLRLVGSIMNRFAHDRCAVAENLASSPAASGTSGQMVDNHGRSVPLPSVVTPENASAVWDASVRLAG